MKAASLRDIRQELNYKSEKELKELCLSMARFKLENKELLTYLLFESVDEDSYAAGIQATITEAMGEVPQLSAYHARKRIRKELRLVKKYIRYSKNKQTEAQALIHFCKELKVLPRHIMQNISIQNLYERQLLIIQKAIAKLHEDLQYDYRQELEQLELEV